jgi:hypothetical protein
LVLETTSIISDLALLKATYKRHLASGFSGNVRASQGMTMTLPHSRPFALWIVLIARTGGLGREYVRL